MIGPTASGKSGLAVKLAHKYNGEIVSADSRQVYRELNIGTGKITKKEMKGVRHFCLDIANPKRQFSAAEYEKEGLKALKEILKNNKIPIVCGGTGFYIDALLGIKAFPDVPPNIQLRKKLSSKPAAELFQILKTLDRERSRTIDRHNPRRLTRAIEIAEALGKIPILPHERMPKAKNILFIGLNPPKEKLKKLIHERLLMRLKKGMIVEAKRLHKDGLSYKRMMELGLEYKYLALLLQKQITKEEFLKKLETEIWRYAKRQMTWFRKYQNVKWFKTPEGTEVERIVSRFLAS